MQREEMLQRSEAVMKRFFFSVVLFCAPMYAHETPVSIESASVTYPLIEVVKEKVQGLNLTDQELLVILHDIINNERNDPAWKRVARKIVKYGKRGVIFSAQVLVTLFLYFVTRDLFDFVVDSISPAAEDDGMKGTTTP